MVKQQCLFGTLLSIKVPGRHFLVPESWRKGVKMTDANWQSGEKEERIIEIEIEHLRPFKEYPFQVKDDKEMFLLQESIEKYGILRMEDIKAGRVYSADEVEAEMHLSAETIRICKKVFTKQQSIWKHFTEICFWMRKMSLCDCLYKLKITLQKLDF